MQTLGGKKQRTGAEIKLESFTKVLRFRTQRMRAHSCSKHWNEGECSTAKELLK